MDFNLQTNQILASGPNLPLVLTPAGTGGLQAQAADGTAAGGNARGINAVDWQNIRAAANQVASGANSVIGGGQNNLANSTNATVAGGSGNLANGTNATVGGGTGNTASGNTATIAGGNGNSATSTTSVVGGGVSNSAVSLNTTVAGGNTNTASGQGAWVPGGQHATTRSHLGRGAWAATRIAAQGDAQCGEHHLLRQTTDATATRLTADSAAAGTANSLNLPNFGAYAGILTVVGKATGSTAAATWRITVSAVRGNGAGTVAVFEGAGTAILPTASNGTGSSWRLDVAADTTNGGIAVTVTGSAATTINWSARFADIEAVTAS